MPLVVRVLLQGYKEGLGWVDVRELEGHEYVTPMNEVLRYEVTRLGYQHARTVRRGETVKPGTQGRSPPLPPANTWKHLR